MEQTDVLVMAFVVGGRASGPGSINETITPTFFISTRGGGAEKSESLADASDNKGAASSLGVFDFDSCSRRWELSRTAFSRSAESRLT